MATFDINLFSRYLTVREINALLGENFRSFPARIRNCKHIYLEEIIKEGYGPILADAVSEKIRQNREEYEARSRVDSHTYQRNNQAEERGTIIGSSMREEEKEG